MHGARLVNTPAMNRMGSAVSGLDESWLEMCEKSTVHRNAKEGCYSLASLFAMIAAERNPCAGSSQDHAANYFFVSSSSKRSIARGSCDWPSQNRAFFLISGSRFVRATAINA